MRPIDADVFEKFIRENCSDSLEDLWCELVRRQPTIEVVPVVHGEWKYYRKKCIAVCKNCSFERNLNENFGMAIVCPNCGADMRKGGENE
jgi:hypothetical protein